MRNLDANQKIIRDGLKAIAGFQQGKDPIRRGLLHALWNFVNSEGASTAQVHTQYCILWGWHDATGDQNTENEKKYLWEEKIFGRRDEGGN